jgi:hypothetical protein
MSEQTDEVEIVVLSWADDRSYALHTSRKADDEFDVDIEVVIKKSMDPKDVANILTFLAKRFAREPGVKGWERTKERFMAKWIKELRAKRATS